MTSAPTPESMVSSPLPVVMSSSPSPESMMAVPSSTMISSSPSWVVMWLVW
ncbi:hypothetical protein PPSIR1_30676 [Plesiocystis pacifica SIR-1]|uniref:Uncharacterized protein n=1 Tax=Plesiocystis pacifica SIR-1 TaxID=391625 RepID=A6GAE8_9BACT|nr:hypothetical protein PPSIR1_30676 [Plesiocystis pacifica SIR-1]